MSGHDEFGAEIADQVESFLIAVRAIATEADSGRAIPLLLLEVSQVLLAGARLGIQTEVAIDDEFQPDVGPEADVEALRLRLAEILGDIDTYGFVFNPYLPDEVTSQISDDISAIVAELENGLRHYKLGNVDEALWWWQFSYLNSWGNLAGAVHNALLTVVSHDRLDRDLPDESDQLAVAGEVALGVDP